MRAIPFNGLLCGCHSCFKGYGRRMRNNRATLCHCTRSLCRDCVRSRFEEQRLTIPSEETGTVSKTRLAQKTRFSRIIKLHLAQTSVTNSPGFTTPKRNQAYEIHRALNSVMSLPLVQSPSRKKQVELIPIGKDIYGTHWRNTETEG